MTVTSGAFLNGTGTPDNADGANNDHYRDSSNQDIWFKSSGLWELIGNLRVNTPDGVGTTFREGVGSPDNLDGADGNYYRNTANQDVWKKTSGAWSLIGTWAGTIIGDTVVATGEGVPSNPTGLDGFYYRDVLTQDIYFKAGGVWTKIGNWAGGGTSGTVLLSGAGAPLVGVGANGDYYRDSTNQDIYLKTAGSWAKIGNWAGTATAFVINNWDMTGSTGPVAVSTTSGAAASPVSAGQYTVTPDATLSATPLGLYAAAVESLAGIPTTGSGKAWASFVKPAEDAGDSLMGYGLAVINSSAHISDLLTAVSGGSPGNPIWGRYMMVRTAVAGSIIQVVDLVASVHIPITLEASGISAGDNIFLGYDYTAGGFVCQKNTGGDLYAASIDLSGMPPGDTFRVVFFVISLTGSVTFLVHDITVYTSSTIGGKTGFQAVGDAVVPVGALDGTIFKVTHPGQFQGTTTLMGDFVQFYNNLNSLVVIRRYDTQVAELQIQITANTGDITTLQTQVGTLQTDVTALQAQAVYGSHAELIYNLAEHGVPAAIDFEFPTVRSVTVQVDLADTGAITLGLRSPVAGNPPGSAGFVEDAFLLVVSATNTSGTSSWLSVNVDPVAPGVGNSVLVLSLPVLAGTTDPVLVAIKLQVRIVEPTGVVILGCEILDTYSEGLPVQVYPIANHYPYVGVQPGGGVGTLMIGGSDSVILADFGEVMTSVNVRLVNAETLSPEGVIKILFVQAIPTLNWYVGNTGTVPWVMSAGATLPISVAANTLVEIAYLAPHPGSAGGGVFVCTRVETLV